jgi:hypothetical protein
MNIHVGLCWSVEVGGFAAARPLETEAQAPQLWGKKAAA